MAGSPARHNTVQIRGIETLILNSSVLVEVGRRAIANLRVSARLSMSRGFGRSFVAALFSCRIGRLRMSKKRLPRFSWVRNLCIYSNGRGAHPRSPDLIALLILFTLQTFDDVTVPFQTFRMSSRYGFSSWHTEYGSKCSPRLAMRQHNSCLVRVSRDSRLLPKGPA